MVRFVRLSRGSAAAFAAKVFDAARNVTAEEVGTKKGNAVSLAISRLRSGDQRATYLDVKVKELLQKIELQQFDAAAAVLASRLTIVDAVVITSRAPSAN